MTKRPTASCAGPIAGHGCTRKVGTLPYFSSMRQLHAVSPFDSKDGKDYRTGNSHSVIPAHLPPLADWIW
jgi:hypothetical protein